MPAYGTFAAPTAIYDGDSAIVWNNETPASGTASERVAIGSMNNLAVQLSFSAAPGAFTCDVQVADIDQPGAYSTLTGNSITTVTAGNYSYQPVMVKANFVRLIMTTKPASDAVTATISSAMGGRTA